MEFLHTGKHVAGFYRNPNSAHAEALVVKRNAANGPAEPREGVRKVKDRMEEMLKAQGNQVRR